MNVNKAFQRLGQGRNIGDRAEKIYDYLKRMDNNPNFDTNPAPKVVDTGDTFTETKATLVYGREFHGGATAMTFSKPGYEMKLERDNNTFGAYNDVHEKVGENSPEHARIWAVDGTWDIEAGSALNPTGEDILGPYYRAGAPERSDVSPGVKGDRLALDFTVRNKNGERVPNTKVEIWMSDAEGNYDNESDAFSERGWQTTNETGRVNFESIRPGNYAIPGEIRPAHIHLKLDAPGHKPLVTQLYFKDDPYNHTDNWYSPQRELYVDPHTPQKVAESKGPIQLGSGSTTVTLEKVPQKMSYDFVVEKLES